jgi:endonuclease-3
MIFQCDYPVLPNSIPTKSGIYTLMIDVTQPITTNIGRFPKHTFPRGIYTYTGSARGRSNNLYTRIGRHLRTEKKEWWHIDYLLSSKLVRIPAIVYYPTSLKSECHVAHRIEQLVETTSILKGFGSSDCTSGCTAHLHYFPGSILYEATTKVATIYNEIFFEAATVQYT